MLQNKCVETKKILVFDSGVGGFSIVNEIKNQNLGVFVNYLADSEFFPYGLKSDLDLIRRIPNLIAKGVEETKADAVIIACNTASTIALYAIRELVKIPVIGVVPAIKPAALISKTKTIGLLATPRTIGSAYTDQLIEDFAPNTKVIRYGPPDLARAAEEYILNGKLDKEIIKQSIEGLFSQNNSSEIDVIVLACTHYPLVKEFLSIEVKREIIWIDSGQAIAKRLAQILNLETNKTVILNKALSTGGNDLNFKAASLKLGFTDFSRINLKEI